MRRRSEVPLFMRRATTAVLAIVLASSGWTVPGLTYLRGITVALAEEATIGESEPEPEVSPTEAEVDLVETPEESSSVDDDQSSEGETGDQVVMPAMEEEPKSSDEDESIFELVALVSDLGEFDGGDEVQGEEPDNDPQVYLSPDMTSLFSDQDLEVTYALDEAIAGDNSYFTGVEVGVFRMRNETEGYFEPNFTGNANAYTYDSASQTVTLHGTWLWENYFKEHQNEQLRISVWLYQGYDEHGDPRQVHPYNPGVGYYSFRETAVDYDFEKDVDLLPGWDGNISGKRGVRVCNAEHPDGWDTEYAVVDVAVKSGEEHLEDFRRNGGDNDYSWYYRAKDFGDVVFEVTYLDLAGERQTYEFTAHVSGDVFSVDLYVSAGDRWGLPGESVQLEAYGRLWQHDDEGDRYTDTDDANSGLTVEWHVAEGNDCSTIDTQGNAAMLTFGELPEGQDFQRVVVEAFLMYDGEQVAYDWEDLEVRDSYTTITPFAADFPFRTAIGGTFTVEPHELERSASSDQADVDITESSNVHFDLWFDANAVSVAGDGITHDDNNAGHVSWDGVTQLTFTRLREWQTNISLDSSWMEGEFQKHDRRDWWLDNQNYDIWFDGAPNRFFVEDATSTATLPLYTRNLEGATGLSLAYTVGIWENDEWSQEFTAGTEYTVDEERNYVILNGQAILDAVGANTDRANVRVLAKVIAGDEQIRETDCWVEVIASSIEYDQECDRDILPGWDGRVDKTYRVRVRNAENPDGWDTDYEVTNVDVASGAEHLEEFRREDDGNGWYYRAKDFGVVTLKVTYVDLDGVVQSYEFDLYVVGTTYDFQLTSSQMGDHLLPGSTAEVWAQGWRHTATYVDDDNGGHYEYADTKDNLSYAWKLEEGADIATMTEDSADPTHITLSINDLPDDEDWIDSSVLIRAHLSDGEDADVASIDWAYWINTDFIEPYPAAIDAHMQKGMSQDIAVELRQYVYGQDGYTTIDDAQFLFWFDTNCVSIVDSQGSQVVDNGSRPESTDEVSYGPGTFTITRTGEWGTDINVRAVWTEDGEEQDYGRTWRLDNLDYDLWFDGQHDLDVWAGNGDGSYSSLQNASNTVRLSDELAGIDGLTIEYVVGTWDNDDYVETFGPESGLYSVSADGFTITSDAAKMAETGKRDLRVCALAKLGDTVLCESHEDFWFHLCEAEEHYDLHGDEDVLVGWWGRVDHYGDAFVRNLDNPDGDHVRFEVTNVEILHQSPAEGVGQVIKLDKYYADDDVTSEDFWWEYEALGHGSATMKITYTDVAGQSQTHEFTVTVTTDVYQLDVWHDGSGTTLPGGTVSLRAEGVHHQEHALDTQEGLTYQWEIDQQIVDAGICTFAVDENDTSHATVTFTATPDHGAQLYWQEAWVTVHLLDEGKERASNWINAVCCSDYEEIWPATIERSLDVNQSVTITPEVRRYCASFLELDDPYEYEVIEGATFSWSANENGAQVEDLGNGSYRITRLAHWANNVELQAQWTNDEGPRQDNRHYFLSYRDYHLMFDNDQVEVGPEGTVTLTLNLGSASAVGVAQDVTVLMGDGDWHDGDNPGFDVNLTDFKVEVVDDETLTITVVGSALIALDLDHVNVRAALDYGDPSDIVVEWADVNIESGLSVSDAEVVLDESSFTYDGTAHNPQVTVNDGAFTEGIQYSVSYGENINAGTGSVTITGLGVYGGSKTVEFTINGKPVTVTPDAQSKVYGNSDPTLTATVEGLIGADTVDYQVSRDQGEAAGTYQIVATATYKQGNYLVSVSTDEVLFTISRRPVTVTVNNLTKTYGTVDPELTAAVAGALEAEPVEYDLSRVTGENAGTYAITATGEAEQGNYTVTFKNGRLTIGAKAISDKTIAVDTVASQIYTGSAINPTPAVKDGSKTLVAGSDYTLSYAANINAGKATITITGKGNYGSSRTVTFIIVAKSFSSTTITNIDKQKWTGKDVTPKLTVKDGAKTLTLNTDYTLSYSNNVNPGTATVTVTGKGNYSGSKTVKFTIGAKTGAWKQSGSKWWYRYDDGSYPRSQFADIDGARYYFDGSGWMVTGWRQIGNKWYYFRSDGKMGANDWVKSGSRWCYLGSDGVMVTGWKDVSGKRYYFDGSGYMVTGWRQIGGKWYYFESSGAMAKSKWVKSGSKWCYLKADGTMVTGWLELSGKKYYMDGSGYMVTGWKQISGKYYHFESSGAMAKSKWVGNYYLGSDGAMLVSTVTPDGWQVDANGKAVKKVS